MNTSAKFWSFRLLFYHFLWFYDPILYSFTMSHGKRMWDIFFKGVSPTRNECICERGKSQIIPRQVLQVSLLTSKFFTNKTSDEWISFDPYRVSIFLVLNFLYSTSKKWVEWMDWINPQKGTILCCVIVKRIQEICMLWTNVPTYNNEILVFSKRNLIRSSHFQNFWTTLSRFGYILEIGGGRINPFIFDDRKPMCINTNY